MGPAVLGVAVLGVAVLGVAILDVVIAADSGGGGVIFTLGDVKERRTELFPARLQEETESDLERPFMLLERGLPREVPPLMMVVELGVGGTGPFSFSSCLDIGTVADADRLPNLPPKAAVMGT